MDAFFGLLSDFIPMRWLWMFLRKTLGSQKPLSRGEHIERSVKCSAFWGMWTYESSVRHKRK